MLKKILTVAFVFLFVFVLSGCEFNILKGKEKSEKYSKSFESILDRFCYLAENNGTYEEFIALVPEEYKSILETQVTTENEKKNIFNDYLVKKCTYTIGDDLDKETKYYEDSYNDEFNTNREISEIKSVNLYLDDKETSEAIIAFKSDGKWYTIIYFHSNVQENARKQIPNY